MFHTSTQRPPRRTVRRKRRSGTASVEFAICLPMIAFLVFGAIEASNAIFLQQALTSAAYEAGNVASTDGGTSTTAKTRAQAVLTGLGAKSVTVTISPTVTSSTATGTTIVVTCTAPLSANSVTSSFLGNKTLTAKYTIVRL